jgi:nitrate reductase NapAB chaperone NapD
LDDRILHFSFLTLPFSISLQYGTQSMIASVVATLEGSEGDLQGFIDEISKIPCVEVGSFGTNPRRVPITIDSSDPDALEETTRRLQECCGVAFVDVVFVHFEEESERPTETHTGKQKRS